MPSSTIHRPWNSVDIRGADGLLYHGRVIDCVEEGLVVIDLGCETPQLVPFGQVYRFYTVFHPPEVTERMPVDALMRLQLTEPARWYPAIFLAGEVGCLGSFGLVLVTTPEGTTMEVLPANRIQQHTEQAIWSLVRRTGLVKEQVPLPLGVSSGTPSPGLYKTPPADQHLVDCFNLSNSGVRILATHIDGGILHVLKGADRFALEYSTFDRQLKGETLLRMLGVEPQGALGVKRKRQDNTDGGGTVTMSITETLGITEPKPISNYLLKELLAEVFTYLDGLEQVRLRMVCSKWNDILTALPVTRTLCVGVPEDKKEQSVVRVKSLCKQWTGRTKIIINTSRTTRKSKDGGSYLKEYRPLLCSGRLFRCIMQESQLPQLENVILANVTWNWHKPVEDRGPHFSYFVDHICVELNSLTSVCRSLVLKNVNVELLKLNFTTLNGDLARITDTPLIVHISEGRIVGKIRVETMWSMMENSLPYLSSADFGRWLELVQGADNDLIQELLKVLTEYQSADPRVSNQLRNKQWTAEDLPVIALGKLSRITLQKVLKIACNEPLIFNFHW